MADKRMTKISICVQKRHSVGSSLWFRMGIKLAAILIQCALEAFYTCHGQYLYGSQGILEEKNRY
jgi:hypothetical protein